MNPASPRPNLDTNIPHYHQPSSAMSTDAIETVSNFILDAPPGEVVPSPSSAPYQFFNASPTTAPRRALRYLSLHPTLLPHTAQKYLDVKSLIGGEVTILQELSPAIEKYNKEQLVTTKLPGSSGLVCAPPRNGRHAATDTGGIGTSERVQ
jgi:hypothetical protein